jgi:carotenoid cleavage dioxygenase-like enzyme
MNDSTHTAGWTSVERTVPEPVPLRVQGELPDWLTGAVVRTGPAKFEANGRSLNHWFDGFAMLDRFAVAGGGVTYASRMLESRAYRAASENGEISYMEFATDPCRSLFKRVASAFSPKITDNANVNVTRLGERWIAMTETPMQAEFDPETLATVGVVDYEDERTSHGTIAHPHHDARRGELLSFTMRYGPRSHYDVYRLPDGSRARQTFASAKTDKPSYMHSFAMTPRHLVLFESPFRVNPMTLLLSGRPFIENFRWEPERGTRFLVFDREDGSLTGVGEAEPFFVFHQVNAFERDGEIVVDLCAYDDAGIVKSFYLDRLRAGQAPPLPYVRRYRVPIEGGEAVREHQLTESMELPRINYRRCVGRDYRYAWAAATTPGGAWFDEIAKADVTDGTTITWTEDGCHPGEPVFVAPPHPRGEDDGVILSVVLDSKRDLSFLLVLDAATLTELARAAAPMRLPFGFHAQYAR